MMQHVPLLQTYLAHDPHGGHPDHHMEQRPLNELTDPELLAEAKSLRPYSVTNALFIGFLVGILVYSAVRNSWGFFSLIPLYLVYRLVNDPKNKRAKEVERLMKEKGLQ